jgi:hypothetical protein
MIETFHPLRKVRQFGTFVRIKADDKSEMSISQELDIRFNKPIYIRAYLNGGLFTIQQTDKYDKDALYVYRYNREGKHGKMNDTRIINKELCQWLIRNGYESKQRIHMIERRPGVWAEDK